MPTASPSSFEQLTPAERNDLCRFAHLASYPADSLIFSENDEADMFYIVESGTVSIFIKKYHRTEDIALLEKGACFGEMGLLANTQRSASARTNEPTSLYCIDKSTLTRFIQEHPETGRHLYRIVSIRNEELALKESVLVSTGLASEHLHVSIKGDPSLRETVFERERYSSLVDPLLPDLVPSLEEMLLNRNVYRIFIDFNSAEIRIHTIFNPFTPEMHAADKLTSSAYLNRHFPQMTYQEKNRLIDRIFTVIHDDEYIEKLSDHWQHLFIEPLRDWQPVPQEKIRKTLSTLPALRRLENFYLKNINLNSVHDVIRMQFNCDGTHIVNSNDYQRFLDENI